MEKNWNLNTSTIELAEVAAILLKLTGVEPFGSISWHLILIPVYLVATILLSIFLLFIYFQFSNR